MNPALAFVLIASVGYFASSMLRGGSDPKQAFGQIVSALDEMSSTRKFVTKTDATTYCFWPKGIIDAVSYDGAFCTYVQCDVAHLSFTLTTMMFHQGKWTQMETRKVGAQGFALEFNKCLGMPHAAKAALLNVTGATSPVMAPKGAKPQ